METWALDMAKHGDLGPFKSYEEMYNAIDATRLGDAPWKCWSSTYDGEKDSAWKSTNYEVWYRDPDVVLRNMLDNPDFDGQFDYTPYIRRDKTGQRMLSDFMTGNFAWNHAVSSLILMVVILINRVYLQ